MLLNNTYPAIHNFNTIEDLIFKQNNYFFYAYIIDKKLVLTNDIQSN